MDRDELAPLVGGDIPEAQRLLPIARAQRRLPDPGIVDQDVDRAEPAASLPDDVGDSGLAAQIGLDRQQVRLPALLTRRGADRIKAVAAAVDRRNADAGAEQPLDQGPPDAARRTGHNRRPLCIAHRLLLHPALAARDAVYAGWAISRELDGLL